MRVLFIAWQDPDARRWITVGRLTHDADLYRFEYTHGAKTSKNFEPFGRMRDLNSGYSSKELFPLFANRILPKSRPEYRDYLRWLGLDESEAGDLEVLARSGGIRATDSLEMFPRPEPNSENAYEGYFFSHGLRHLAPENLIRAKSLRGGDRLYLTRDIQNEHDPNALLLRTDNPIAFVGYCPRYFSTEFCDLIKRSGSGKVVITVSRTNQDAPSELTLLCKIVAPWPKGFSPCTRGDFKILAKPVSSEKKQQPEYTRLQVQRKKLKTVV